MSGQGFLLPFYMVVDASYSMEGAKIDAANELLPVMAQALEANPILNGTVRFALMDFADEARIILPLSNITEVDVLPRLTIRGGTNYGDAFRLLRTQLSIDINQLHTDGFQLGRPAILFVSDGDATDREWLRDFDTLTNFDRESGVGFAGYPVIIPFGIGDADIVTLRELVFPRSRSRVYLMHDAAAAADIVQSIAAILVSSVMASEDGLLVGDLESLPLSRVTSDGYDDWLE